MSGARSVRAFTANPGFTLIELLVVIAIIAILAAALMPALQTATDRSRVTECRAHLTHIGMALRMYYDDQGGYPGELVSLSRAGFITDDSMLDCTKTGTTYWYTPPVPGSPFDTVVAACVDPHTKKGHRPHSFRNSFVELQKGGKIVEIGR